MIPAAQAFTLIVVVLIAMLAVAATYTLLKRSRKPKEDREPVKEIFTNRGAASALTVIITLSLLVLLSTAL